MKKIVHFIHNDGPGGGPMTVINQINYLKQYFNIHVLHGGWGKLADFCDNNDILHTQIPIEKKIKIPLGIAYLWMHLFRIRPDLVILHGQWAGPIGAIVARMAGIKKIIYIAHWPAFYTDWDLFRVLRNYIAELIPCRLASRVIPLSVGNKYQYLIRRVASEKKFTIINNSFDPSTLPNDETIRRVRLEHGWSEKECHVVSVGRLADQKKIDWLLKSWELVMANRCWAHLWIIGDGPEKNTMKSLAKSLSLDDSCHFLGTRNGINYIAAADIVVMSTLYEGHANIPLEAMGCGKPIIANDVDGVGDSFTDGVEGFLVSPADIIGFADSLIKLISNPSLRQTMGNNGMERVKAFHPEIKIKQLMDVIEQVIYEP